MANTGGMEWHKFPKEKMTDVAALQNGAKLFVDFYSTDGRGGAAEVGGFGIAYQGEEGGQGGFHFEEVEDDRLVWAKHGARRDAEEE